jgi:hypothetical protein
MLIVGMVNPGLMISVSLIQQILPIAILCQLPQHRARRVVGAPAGLHPPRSAPRPQHFHGQLGLQRPWNVREKLHFQEQPANSSKAPAIMSV